MAAADWIWVGSVVIAIGPTLGGVIWFTIASVRAHGKDEV